MITLGADSHDLSRSTEPEHYLFFNRDILIVIGILIAHPYPYPCPKRSWQSRLVSRTTFFAEAFDDPDSFRKNCHSFLSHHSPLSPFLIIQVADCKLPIHRDLK